ncbi:17686_t:CDS:1 [Cetraspora pellucida]|uniref:17686_t:CDS:1 n=1 Tax=Cetraspora pellucida TaxID=1433469 RepID=A0A9N9HCC5_9GLOM|nr:17686_t:CDS:1 [Cetraspora pellucida]
MIANQVVCYGLPFGTFGFICWTLSFVSSLLLYLNFPLFSPWKWCKPYQSQGLLIALISATFTIGPTIFTCLRCKGYWPFTVIAIGQLSPWSFKMFNDGVAAMIKNDQDNDGGRNMCYACIGGTMSCVLGGAGWIGLTALCFGLLHTSYAVSKWVWAVYLIPIFFVILALLCRGRGWALFAVFAYFASTTHIIGSHIILSNISGNWSGFPTEKVALASSLIFFIGKRLLYVNC